MCPFKRCLAKFSAGTTTVGLFSTLFVQVTENFMKISRRRNGFAPKSTTDIGRVIWWLEFYYACSIDTFCRYIIIFRLLARLSKEQSHWNSEEDLPTIFLPLSFHSPSPPPRSLSNSQTRARTYTHSHTHTQTKRTSPPTHIYSLPFFSLVNFASSPPCILKGLLVDSGHKTKTN